MFLVNRTLLTNETEENTMGIIINDFEVVVEPPPANTAVTGGQSQERQQANVQFAAPNPHDIELINRHFEKRRERLVAD